MRAMAQKTRPGLTVAMRGLLVAIFICGLCFPALVDPLRTDRAYAAEQVHLHVGERIPYAGYHTNRFNINGQYAYCANPSKVNPPSGMYEAHALESPPSRHDAAGCAPVFYYGYSGPGYQEGIDAGFWPQTWYDGSPMTDEHYYAITHIVVTDMFSDYRQALFGCNQQFNKWWAWNFPGLPEHNAWAGNGSVDRWSDAFYGKAVAAYEKLSPQVKAAFENSIMIIDGGSRQSIITYSASVAGSLELYKSSSTPTITENNRCYSLEGAIYGVYSDEACTTEVARLTTNVGGFAEVSSIACGAYWVREISAPQGFVLDPTVHAVTIEAGTTTRMGADATLSDVPISNPVEMLVQKHDATTGKSAPLGAGTLEKARFTLEYYDGYYETVEAAAASGEPCRTWTVTTDETGSASFDDAHLLTSESDALFYNETNKPVIPLGTVVVTEVEPPRGYLLQDEHHNPVKPCVIQITADESSVVSGSTSTYHPALMPDVGAYGDIRLVKEVPTTNNEEDQEFTRLVVSGVQFQIINDSEHAVVSPETGEEVQPGDVVCTITTDENGLASTKNSAAVNRWEKPANWTGALFSGNNTTYKIREIIPDTVVRQYKNEWGITLIPLDQEWKISLDGEGDYPLPQLIANHPAQTPLKIVKKDAETNRAIPLAGCQFQLFNAAGELVTYTDHANDDALVDTWTTNDKGEVILPMKLSEGTYSLKEITAPEGYTLTNEAFEFVVDDYRTWDNPIIVEFKDTPIKGRLILAKTDSTTNTPLPFAEYTVKAKSDIVTGDMTVRAHAGDIVATGVTNEDGILVIEDLYLGEYLVYENKAPDGYALDTEEYVVFLESEGQDTPLVSVHCDLTNTPTTLKVLKVDSENHDLLLVGATFRIWQDDVDKDAHAASPYDQTFITDENGLIEIGYLKHGTYHIAEISAPEGYGITDPIERGFTVNDQGMIEIGEICKGAVGTLTIENTKREIRTSAVDQITGTHSGQASVSMTIVDAVEYRGLDPNEPYTMRGTLMDKATGEPLLVEGKPITAKKTFTPQTCDGTIEIEFVFDSSNFIGTETVVFEECYNGEELIAHHTDLTDENQTVRIVDLRTSAINNETNDHEGILSADICITDTVHYVGLTPHEEYTLFGTLMDKATGAPLLSQEQEVTAQTVFVPDFSEGTVEVEFIFDGSALADIDVVVFENCYCGETLIARHANLEDENQTVRFTQETPEGKASFLPQTGDPLWQFWWVVAALILIGVAGLGGATWHTHKKASRSTEEETLRKTTS